MGDYSKYISDARRPIPTPERLVGTDGKCVFGTFESEFRTFALTEAERPTDAPQLMNGMKLTRWEACEICLKDGVLLSGVCNMGLFGVIVNVFYDKRTGRATQWSVNVPGPGAAIAPNLLGGSVTEGGDGKNFVRYKNTFENGECLVSGRAPGKYGEAVNYEFTLKRISKPSVVSIPFGPNRPLYTQKDFFKAEGKLTVNGETFASDENTVAIIDDHRGYYPRRAHYDWVTTMGRCVQGGEEKFIAVNLTKNQSIDPEKYNENLIWLEGRACPLPPVRFQQSVKSAESGGKSVWTVRDDHGMVDVSFETTDMVSTIAHAGIVNIDYYIAFGGISGYVMDEDGNRYVLDGLPGIGEDKTLLF